MSELLTTITVSEPSGLSRNREPVSFGVPLPCGTLFDAAGLALQSSNGSLPLAATPSTLWPDGSVKWLLIDCQLSLDPEQELELALCKSQEPQPAMERLELHELPNALQIRNGGTLITMATDFLFPLGIRDEEGRAFLREDGTRVVLTDDSGDDWMPKVDNWKIETHNALRISVMFSGSFVREAKTSPFRFISRMHVYAGVAAIRIDFTICNPGAARHASGVWDLGDPGSLFFRDLRLEFASAAAGRQRCRYTLDACGSPASSEKELLIYQDSSGGDAWRSSNHLNGSGEIPLSFKGYQVRAEGQVVGSGLRATPSVQIAAEAGMLSMTLRHFWQNFPKALQAGRGRIGIHLFPHHFKDVFELQGGERKTHTLFLMAGAGDVSLDWVHEPLRPRISESWYVSSKAGPKCAPALLPKDQDCGIYEDTLQSAVVGAATFQARREKIDEYGWRNFGEIYADHEAVYQKGSSPFISHYNNQYDVIKGALLQFIRNGASDWYTMADELAGHVVDVDIYHTQDDRYEYNGGLFWHTDHHMDAATCTHRTYSRRHREQKNPLFVGGGPSYEHNYATGLLLHYWFTGEERSREGVLTLADFVVRGLRGPDTLSQTLFNSVKALQKKVQHLGKSPSLQVFRFDGPGRGSGNSLNVLLDAFSLTQEQTYLQWAEDLIERCVAPDERVEDRGLLNRELRWMYVVFLQALGRYLDVKRELGLLDDAFWYARSVLLRYALWMAEYEYPYLDRPEDLQYPNETWAAQEIRKSDIFAQAAAYAPKQHVSLFGDKARYYFAKSMQHLQFYGDTRFLTRPIAILMTNGHHFLTMENSGSHDAMEELDLQHGCRLHPPALLGLLDKNLKKTYCLIINVSLSREIAWWKKRLEGR